MSDTLLIVCAHCRASNRVPAARLTENPVCGRCHQALFQAHPMALDKTAFPLHLSRDELPLLVDFWAPWCGPCLNMAPEFERAAKELEPHMRLAKVDTEAEPDIGAQFAIRSIPTLILFHGGREVARQSGGMRSADIVRWAQSARIADSKRNA